MVNWCCRYYNYQETGFYYLQSRYYDPEICRFINADTFATTDIDGLLSTNMFSYCENNPVLGVDQNGEFLDTIFDVISLGMSVADVVSNPSDPWAWAGLVGDIVDLVPGVTGVGEITKGLGAAHKATKAVDNGIDTYRNLKKAYKGSGKEVHHIIEKRFAKSFNIKDTNSMLSIALDKAEHAKYTKLWRKELPYGKTYTRKQILTAAEKIYADNQKLLQAARKTMK